MIQDDVTEIRNWNWALMQLCNFSGRFRTWIIENGGAENCLEMKSWSILEKEFTRCPKFEKSFNTPKMQKALHGLRNFTKTGGHIIGGSNDKELGLLKRAKGYPLCFFARGQLDLLEKNKIIAIVGSRKASAKGIARAAYIAKVIHELGGIVVSGGAEGIDLAAHQGILEEGSATIVVLGNAVSSADERPQRIRALAEAYPEKILTLTAYASNVTTSARLFVARNQYIAALAKAVILVEGGAKSGALHTANFAKKMNIPVYAIPGDPDEQNAAAANILLSRKDAFALIDIRSQLQSIFYGEVKSKKKDKVALLKKFHNESQELFNYSHKVQNSRNEEMPLGNHPEIKSSKILQLLLKYRSGIEPDVLADLLSMDMRNLSVNISLLEMEDKILKSGSLVLLNESAFRT